MEQARTFFVEGVEHFEAGRLEVAHARFEAALGLAPGRPSVLCNLGIVKVRLGRYAEGLPLLDDALAQEPDNGEALSHRAMALAQLDRPVEALRDIERALQIAPAYGRGWGLKGELLRTLGRRDEAIAALQWAIQLGSDVDLHRYTLAGLQGGGDAPPAPPEGYVEALFDGYADRFETHLVGVLHYQGPQELMRRLPAPGRRFDRALDLGCGTGLCGPLLRPLATRVAGVDLSARMLERARATAQYDELHQADVVSWLTQTSGPWELVVAADVFVYLGAMEPSMAQLARVVPPGGWFGLTLEESTGEPLVLLPSLRYAHSEAAIRAIGRAHGFEVRECWRAPIRSEQREAVPGLYVWMERVVA